MRTHHQIMDLNNDGVVSWDDFQELIKKFTVMGNLQPSEVQSFTDALKVGTEYSSIERLNFLIIMQFPVQTGCFYL